MKNVADDVSFCDETPQDVSKCGDDVSLCDETPQDVSF